MIFRKLLVLMSCMALILNIVPVAAFALPDEAKNQSESFFIDPGIQGRERAVLTELMKSLEPEFRENVIYVTSNGEVFANRPELKTGVIR